MKRYSVDQLKTSTWKKVRENRLNQTVCEPLPQKQDAAHAECMRSVNSVDRIGSQVGNPNNREPSTEKFSRSHLICGTSCGLTICGISERPSFMTLHSHGTHFSWIVCAWWFQVGTVFRILDFILDDRIFELEVSLSAKNRKLVPSNLWSEKAILSLKSCGFTSFF